MNEEELKKSFSAQRKIVQEKKKSCLTKECFMDIIIPAMDSQLSWYEHMLDVHGVTGSSPVLSTIQQNQKRYLREKPRSFNDFRVFLRPIFEVGKKDIKKGFGKISGLVPLPKAFWTAFPEIFRESGSFLLSAKCRISTGVFVGLAEHPLQAQIPTRQPAVRRFRR